MAVRTELEVLLSIEKYLKAIFSLLNLTPDDPIVREVADEIKQTIAPKE